MEYKGLKGKIKLGMGVDFQTGALMETAVDENKMVHCTKNENDCKSVIDKATSEYLDAIRKEVQGIPGAEITVDQERNGPPVGKALNIEITGENYPDLIASAKKVKY